jgi:bis(5'-adenosyl)-triphosphatase
MSSITGHPAEAEGTEAPNGIPFGPRILLHPDQVFFEGRQCYGVVNLKPIVPGHVLIISKRNVPRLRDLTPDEISDLFQCATTVGSALEVHFGACALNVAVQDGAGSGQTVPHVHVHLLPRRKGDFDRNDEVHERLEVAGADDRSPRGLDAMRAESLALRALFPPGNRPRWVP